MSKAKATRKLPSVKLLRECFTYDHRTGELWWKVRPRSHFATESYRKRWNDRYALRLAGCIEERGYCLVGIFKKMYFAHRVIFKLMIGDDPPETIDHEDHDPRNNRLGNLRTASQLNQLWNSRRSANTVSGRRGVTLDRRRGKWRARIKTYGAERWLGYFATVEQASQAYEKAARDLHGAFFCGVNK